MNYVNGMFLSKREDFASINPSTKLPLACFPRSTPEEVNSAVKAARNAFNSWRKVSRIKRAEYFDKICQKIKSKEDLLATAISKETGKSLNESYAEVIETLHMAQYCFGKGREPYGEVVASELAERDCYVIRKPKGVVAVITPWNFPLAISFWNAGPALVEGNTVVFKPSELTPIVGQMIAELYDEVGIPPGVFNMVHGASATGASLVKSDVNHISFTGSVEVGKFIREECSTSIDKTCSCEMGSKSAVIVFDDCDFDLAVSAAVNSAFKLSGQRCVSASRIIVQDTIIDKFIDKFVDETSKIIITNPFVINKGFTIGPLISEEQMKKVLAFNQMVREDKDAQVLCDLPAPTAGYFVGPFAYRCDWSDKPYLHQEVFGPHVAIIPFQDVSDAIEIYNDTEYGLAVGICTNDYKKMRLMKEECDAGMIYFNLGSIGAESHLPFTGVKKSGYGGSSAAGAFDNVVHKVAVTVNHGEMTFPQGMK